MVYWKFPFLWMFLAIVKDPPFASSEREVALPWTCTFGESVDDFDWCLITQDQTDDRDWSPWSGLTPTPNTGPPEENILDFGLNRYYS